MRAYVDPDLCTGCELCVQTCPDVFKMNDQGIAESMVDSVPAGLEDLAREAAEQCPVTAISVK